MDLITLGKIMRQYNIVITFSHGSGGYCASIETLSGKVFEGYSWEIEGALIAAIKKIEEARGDGNMDTIRPGK